MKSRGGGATTNTSHEQQCGPEGLKAAEQRAGGSGALGHRRAGVECPLGQTCWVVKNLKGPKTLKSQSMIFSHIGIKLEITEEDTGNSQISDN